MPSNLYRRGNIWWARIQVRGRDVRRSLRTSSLVKAKKNLKALQDDIEHLRFYGEERRTWKVAVVEWAKIAPSTLKPKVFERYQTSLRQVRPHLDKLYLDEIERKVMAEIVESERIFDMPVTDRALDQQVELTGNVVVALAVVMPEHPSRFDVGGCADNCAGCPFIERDGS